MKYTINKLLEEVLQKTEGGDPKAAEVAKVAAAHAERVAKEVIEAQQDEVRAALKKAAETRPLDLRQIPGSFIFRRQGLEADCPGAVCGAACGAGCLGGCLIGGVALVGLGAAAGTGAGAGTAIAICS